MADAFDPDAFLSGPAVPSGGFDPDAYLKTAPAESSAAAYYRQQHADLVAAAKQKTAIGPDQSASIFGTPIEKQGKDYGENLDLYYDAAAKRVHEGVEGLLRKPQLNPSPGPLSGPFAGPSVGSNLFDIAAGVGQGIVAPVTAALNPTWEKYTGIPGGEAVDAVLGGRSLKGVAAMRQIAGLPAEAAAAARAPATGNALTWTGANAGHSPPVDMGALEGALAPGELPSGGAPALLPEAGAPAAIPQAAEAAPAATPRPGQNDNVRLLGPTVPHAGRASVGAAAADVDPLAGYAPETIAKARASLAENGLDNPHVLEQVLDETSQHHTLGELAPGLETKMGGIAAADTGEARNTIVQTMRERAREAPQRMAAVFDRVFGEPQNRAELQRSIEAERAKTATPLWRTFTNTTVAPTPEIRSLLPRLDAAGALKAANKAMREEGLPAQQGFGRMVTDEAGEWAQEVEHVPTAAAFQYAKEHLDSLIEKSLAEPGGAKAARRYTLLKNDLVNAIDNHPDPNVAGVWQEARQAWQRPTELIEAQKLGRRMLTNNIDRDDVLHLTAGWSPERLEHLEIGLRGYLEDLEKANRNPRRVSNRLMDAVLSPGNQEKIRSVLREDRANELIDSIRHEEAMHGAPDRVYGNSATSSRQTAKAEFMAQPGPLEGVSLHDVMHPKTSMLKGAANFVFKKQVAKREAEAAKLREELARMFTTQGAERDAVARALIGAESPPAAGWSRPPGGPSMPSPGVAAVQQRPGGATSVPGGWRAVTPQQIAAGAVKPPRPAPIPAEAAAPKGQSLLEFLASKGGVEPTPEIMGILGKNKFLGSHGWILRKGGLSEDRARALAAESGYIANEGRGGVENRGGGTSTIRDLHEAINDEARGRKRYAMGEERMQEMSPEEQRYRFENDVMEHFDREGVAEPDGKTRSRVLELVEKEGMDPLDAHERAIMEDRDAGQDEGLPAPPPAGKRGKVYPDANAAPQGSAQAAKGEGQPKGGISGQTSRVPGEAAARAAERAQGRAPNVEALKQASAVRLADRMGLTPGIQHLAMIGKTDAEIAAMTRGRLPVDTVRMVRQHLGIGAPSSLMRADEDIPFAAGGAVPTPAQREAGNYKKHHGRIHGLEIAVENMKGSERSGVGRDGKKWSVNMPAHYGYIKRTEGADGDHVDCYIGPHTKSRKVVVVDQYDADNRKFDEHKCMLGFGTAAQARQTYRRGFSDGKGAQRLGHMREMSIEEFKDWLRYGNTSRPIKEVA